MPCGIGVYQTGSTHSIRGETSVGRIVAEAECGQSRICRWHDAERVRRDDLHPLYPGEAGVHEKGIDQIRSFRASGASWRTISHELGIGAGNTLQGGSAAFRKPSTDAVGKWLIPDSWVSRKTRQETPVCGRGIPWVEPQLSRATRNAR